MTFKGKYVVFAGENDGLLFPILMPNAFIEHKHIACNGRTSKPVSAGFFSICGDDVAVYGESISLNLKSMERDAQLIKIMLTNSL